MPLAPSRICLYCPEKAPAACGCLTGGRGAVGPTALHVALIAGIPGLLLALPHFRLPPRRHRCLISSSWKYVILRMVKPSNIDYSAIVQRYDFSAARPRK